MKYIVDTEDVNRRRIVYQMDEFTPFEISNRRFHQKSCNIRLTEKNEFFRFAFLKAAPDAFVFWLFF